MRIAVLLKSNPYTEEAERALQIISDMLASGHNVTLYLLQDAVRLCQPRTGNAKSTQLEALIEKGLKVFALSNDAKLRGIDMPSINAKIQEGSYEGLVELIDSCDQVVGVL